ncbi:hypothetical protein L2E82_33644 [Cichorium intybus]|uniref:Uncharacterized protein n=1 Tax=Cichorium intybus TaxID=13427 RepID=A0ACB9BL02_CICIN|nr:hypothetical protein L2E82_33644 [Cichorium intybus]
MKGHPNSGEWDRSTTIEYANRRNEMKITTFFVFGILHDASKDDMRKRFQRKGNKVSTDPGNRDRRCDEEPEDGEFIPKNLGDDKGRDSQSQPAVKRGVSAGCFPDDTYELTTKSLVQEDVPFCKVMLEVLGGLCCPRYRFSITFIRLSQIVFNSDVLNLIEIKFDLQKEAESHLPDLELRDGISIAMEDIETSQVWTMRYRFWPNNKSRMYLLENTAEELRSSGRCPLTPKEAALNESTGYIDYDQATTAEYKAYQEQVMSNCARFAQTLMESGSELVSGGTENHSVLVNLKPKGIDGSRVEKVPCSDF